MEKFCIFCGKKPKNKNMEHVLPQWLIEATGDPKRKFVFGRDLRTFKIRSYSLNQFKFPACFKCNDFFSQLESDSKSVISNMIDDKPLDASSFNILLTWFDKVRIGLWLGAYYLDKNFYGGEPYFHIRHRINRADRILLIYKSNENLKGLLITPLNTPFFAIFPSCFGLKINQFYFVNFSSQYIISRRLGLPYPISIQKAKNAPRWWMEVAEGLERIILPLLRVSYNKRCTEIYQPIISDIYASSDSTEPLDLKAHGLFQKSYIKKFFDSTTLGKILILKSAKELIEYPINKTDIWIPKAELDENESKYTFSQTVFKLQNYLLENIPPYSFADEEEGKYIKRRLKLAKNVNKKMLKEIEEYYRKHKHLNGI